MMNKQITQYIVFSSKKRLIIYFFECRQQKIAEPTSVKYFGVVIDVQQKYVEGKKMSH